MDDFYAQLRQKALRSSPEEFNSWLRGPVLLVEILGERGGNWIAGTPLTIESTVLLQDVTGDKALPCDSVDDGGGAQRLAYSLNDLAARSASIEIGRDEACSISIDHHSISKVHAYVVKRPNGSFEIQDAGSRNGVTVNGHRIGTGQGVRIRPEDTIRIGGVLARLVYPRALYAQLRETPKAATFRERLRDRTYARLWLGQLTTFLADSLYRIVLVWWVIARIGAGSVLSQIALITLGAVLAMLLGGGILTDRLPRARILVISLLLRGTAATVIAIAELRGGLLLWHVEVAAVAFGIGEALFLPAATALMPEIVRREDLAGANALTTVAAQCANIAGPMIGAALAALGGHALAFSVVAMFFLLGAMLVLRLPSTLPRVHADGADRSQLGAAQVSSFRGVFEIVRAEPWLWVTSLVFAMVVSVGFTLALVGLPLLVHDSLHLDMSWYAVIQGMFPVGALIGSYLIGRSGNSIRRGWMAYLIGIGIGVAYLAMSLPVTVFGIALAWLLRGVGQTMFNLIWIGTLQQLVPKHMLGRAASLDGFMSMGWIVLSLVGFGWLSSHVQPEVLFLLGGTLATAAPALALILHSRIRTFE